MTLPGYETDMLRIRLIENRTGEYTGVDVFAPVVPSSQVLTLNLADDVEREFYIDGPGVSVFVQDGVSGPIVLSHVDLAVTETLDSRRRNLQGRTAS